MGRGDNSKFFYLAEGSFPPFTLFSSDRQRKKFNRSLPRDRVGHPPPRIGYRSVGLPIISIISAPQLAPLLQGLLSNTDSLVGLANVAARGHDLCVRLHWPKLDFGGSSPLKTPCREADLDDVDNDGSLPPCFRCYDAIDWASPRCHACRKPFGTSLA